MEENFTVAVVSDLHCHAQIKGEEQQSFLIAGARRIPARRHPTEALIELIKRDSISADLLICPGDLTNRVCEAGMSQAFSDLQALKQNLNADELLCCLGNHDVASRGGEGGSDPFKLVRELAPGFPVSDNESKEKLESSGYCLFHHTKDATILLINSVIDHRDKESALRGTFDDTRLNSLDDYLTKEEPNIKKIRIAVMHHHPVLHSFANYESSDTLQNGDAILDVLVKHGFLTTIHGHRHEPRLTNSSTKSGQATVFAAGSFSAILNKLGSMTRNTFHLLEICDDKSLTKGTIKTWEFNFGIGWNPTSFKSSRFLPHQNFSSHAKPVSIGDIANAFLSLGKPVVLRPQMMELLPDISYVLPDTMRALSNDLESKNGIKMTFNEDGDLWSLGQIISQQQQ